MELSRQGSLALLGVVLPVSDFLLIVVRITSDHRESGGWTAAGWFVGRSFN